MLDFIELLFDGLSVPEPKNRIGQFFYGMGLLIILAIGIFQFVIWISHWFK